MKKIKKFKEYDRKSKKKIIIYIAAALALLLVLGSISIFATPKKTSSSGSSGQSSTELLSRINELTAKVNELSAAQNVSVSALGDAVVVNGEVRLPSNGLQYTLNEDAASYTVTGLGTCKDSDVVVPRKYQGLPVTAVGDNAFEGAQIDSINLYEDVQQIGSYAFKDSSVRFIYIYSPIPVTLLVDPIPSTVQGVFVPLELVDTCKGYWTAYSNKVFAIETPESINNTIVTAVANLQMVDAYLVQELYKLNPDKYSQGLEYNVITIDGVLGFEVIGYGECTDTEVIIPAYYNDYPVLQIGEYAFKYNTIMTSVVIPETVKKISSNAFKDSFELKTVRFMSETPPTLSRSSCFDDTVEEFIVPASAKDLYISRFDSALGSSFSSKIKIFDTLESLRAEIDSIKTILEGLVNG